MKHFGSLESTQEARVAIGYASSNSYACIFRAPNFPRPSYLDEHTLSPEPIVNLIDDNNVEKDCEFKLILMLAILCS